MYQNIFFDRRNNGIHLWDDKKGYLKFPYKRYGYILDKNGKIPTLDGKRVRKVGGWEEEDLKNGLIYESDVQPDTRVLIDNYYEDDSVSTGHNILYFDIEVSMAGGPSQPEDAENEVTAIGYRHTNDDKYYILLLDRESKIHSRDTKLYKLSVFKNETELLKAFIEQWGQIKPTIVTGWNSNGYDIPYLLNRTKNILGKNYVNKFSPIGRVEYSEFEERFKIAGISCLDYLLLYKDFISGEKASYTLDAIANAELGHGKIEYDGSLDDLYRTDIEKFIEYNLVDVKLIVELDAKLDFIALAQNICHKGHVSYENIHQTSKYLDGAALVYTRRLGIVAPNRKKHVKIIANHNHKPGETKLFMRRTVPKQFPRSGFLRVYKSKTSTFKIQYTSIREDHFILAEPLPEEVKADYKIVLDLMGAFVKAPIPGKYGWLYDLDLVSLYPSIIMTANISPETKVGRITNWEENAYIQRLEKTYLLEIKSKKTKYNRDQMQAFIEDNKYAVTSNGVLYRTDVKGFIPSILEAWFDERVEYKDAMKKYKNAGDKEKARFFNLRQLVQKVLLNAFYGVLGLPSFRFHDIDNAEAITSTGQSVIKFTSNVANQYYNSLLKTNKDYVIYTDTDSIFCPATPLVLHYYPKANINDPVDMSSKILEVVGAVQEHINKAYDVYSKRIHNVNSHKFFIKQELIGRSGFWVAKKRYAIWVVNEEGIPCDKLDVKGLDVVRSDFPKAFQTFMADILFDILKDKTKDDIDTRVTDFKDAMRKMPLPSLLFSSGVKNISKYDPRYRERFEIIKGTPIHVKASIYYNDLLDTYKIEEANRMRNGEKIKWGYLKSNSMNIKVVGIKGYEDPKPVMNLLETYFDYEKNFNSAFETKLEDFYNAMKWGKIISNKNVKKFFEF